MVYQFRENSASTVPSTSTFPFLSVGGRRESEISQLKEAYQKLECPNERKSCMELVEW
jgi:hypothetical protein